MRNPFFVEFVRGVGQPFGLPPACHRRSWSIRNSLERMRRRRDRYELVSISMPSLPALLESDCRLRAMPCDQCFTHM